MIFAANLKCNHTRASFSEYVNIMEEEILGEKVIVFPPSNAFLMGEFSFIQGAQNFYPVSSGSFTGEIGADMLDEFGIKTVLIGHSERRVILNETNSLIKRKFEFAKERGWSVVYCIGEDLATLESGKRDEFLRTQLQDIDLKYQNLIIAYEPIWAIGTGKSASVDDICGALEFVATFSDAPLLYGGSVNESSVGAIVSLRECDGVLVGTASLDARKFLNLIRSV